MADSDLAAVLEHITDGAESEITHPDDECGIEAGGFCVPHGALRVVAAVEAVLELHQPAGRGTGPQWCKCCATHVTFTRWPCRTYAVIARELNGNEEASDG